MSKEELDKLEEQDPFQYVVLVTVLSNERKIEYPDAEMELAKDYIVQAVVKMMFAFKDAEKSLDGIEIFSKEPQRALKAATDYINGCCLFKIIRNKAQKYILTTIIEVVCKSMMALSKQIGNCRIV